MKHLFNFIAVFTLMLAAQVSTAQTADTTKCYNYYKQLFAQKGVYEVKDGLHEVIVTVRQGDKCDVVMGRVRVENGKLVRPLYVRDETGNYVRPSKKLSDKYELYKLPLEFTITKGVSTTTFITDDNDLIDVFLVDVLKK